MLSIQKILFPTDFSESAHGALPHAAMLAERFGAELHLLHAIVLHEADPHSPSHRFEDMDRVLAELHAGTEEELRTTARERVGSGVEVRHAQRRGISASPVILGYAEEEDVDLVVMGTHGRGAVAQALLGSVSEKLVRLSPYPVYTVRKPEEPATPVEMERIVVPTDFSDGADLALRYARELAAAFGASVDLLHVIEEAAQPAFYAPIVPSRDRLLEDIREQAEDSMRRALTEGEGPDVESETHVETGRPAETIREFAERRGADLLVLGSHGRTGFERVMLGSVAEAVVRRSSIPVLTAKTFGKKLADG